MIIVFVVLFFIMRGAVTMKKIISLLVVLTLCLSCLTVLADDKSDLIDILVKTEARESYFMNEKVIYVQGEEVNSFENQMWLITKDGIVTTYTASDYNDDFLNSRYVKSEDVYFNNFDMYNDAIVNVSMEEDNIYTFELVLGEGSGFIMNSRLIVGEDGIAEELSTTAVYPIEFTGGVPSSATSIFTYTDKDFPEFTNKNTLTGWGVTDKILASGIKVLMNDSLIDFDVPPQLINDRTMVPFRKIFEAMGAVVNFEEETATVFATKGDIALTHQIGSQTLFLNDSQIEMDVASVLVDNRTLMPARFIAEALGIEVEWYGPLNLVIVTD